MKISVKFAWYDLWVGAFIERNHPDYRLVVYVCPLPTLLLVFRFGSRWCGACRELGCDLPDAEPCDCRCAEMTW